MWCNDSFTCCDDLDDFGNVMLERRLLIVVAGVMTVSWKLRIFLSGGCFSENMKNTPNAITTNSVELHEKNAVEHRQVTLAKYAHDPQNFTHVTGRYTQ